MEDMSRKNKSIDNENVIPNNMGINYELYEKIYNAIEKYYHNKNRLFQHAIFKACELIEDNISKYVIQEEIERIQNLIDSEDSDYVWNISDGLDKNTHKNILIFYEDFKNFKIYFKMKGIDISLSEIYYVFKDIIDKSEKELESNLIDKIYNKIKSSLSDKYTENDIIKKYLIHGIDIGLVEIEDSLDIISNSSYYSDVKIILSKFGFYHETYTDELAKKCKNVLNEIAAVGFKSIFESIIESSYEENKINTANKTNERENISSETKREVWRRDQGMCSKCSSREKLEYDHIIPVSKGGSNTARNIELLCQNCNRKKSNHIL